MSCFHLLSSSNPDLFGVSRVCRQDMSPVIRATNYTSLVFPACPTSGTALTAENIGDDTDPKAGVPAISSHAIFILRLTEVGPRGLAPLVRDRSEV